MRLDEDRIEASPERLNRAGEDYLKAVLILQRKTGSVRSLDIAKMLGVSKPQCQRCHKASAGGRLPDHGSREAYLLDGTWE